MKNLSCCQQLFWLCVFSGVRPPSRQPALLAEFLVLPGAVRIITQGEYGITNARLRLRINFSKDRI